MKRIYILPLLLCFLACRAESITKEQQTTEPEPEAPAELPVASEIEYYEFDPSLRESELYSVKAGDRFAYIYPTYEPHICWFGASDDGYVRVEVDLQGAKISSVDVHPFAVDFRKEVAGNKLVLFLKTYDRVCVEFNGSQENPLLIFVNPIDRDRPSKDDPSVLYFEAGKVHNAGAITLTDECRRVYLEPGAIVDGTIFAKDVRGVEISGGGLLRTIDCARSHSDFYQPFSIALNSCESASVRDITNICNSGGWVSLYTNCHHSWITNVHSLGINSAEGVKTNNDSMDIIGGKDIHVSKCFLRGHDDCYCLKSQKFKLKGEVDGIWYDDCIGWNVDAGNTFEIGYETMIDITNVHYTNIHSIHSGTSSSELRRAAVSIHNGGAGTISNVTYENVYLDDVQEFAIYLSCLSHNYNIGYEEDGQTPLTYSPGKIDGVTMTNVKVFSTRPLKGKCVIRGYDWDHTVSNVTFRNFEHLSQKVTGITDAVWTNVKYFSDIRFE